MSNDMTFLRYHNKHNRSSYTVEPHCVDMTLSAFAILQRRGVDGAGIGGAGGGAVGAARPGLRAPLGRALLAQRERGGARHPRQHPRPHHTSIPLPQTAHSRHATLEAEP